MFIQEALELWRQCGSIRSTEDLIRELDEFFAAISSSLEVLHSFVSMHDRFAERSLITVGLIATATSQRLRSTITSDVLIVKSFVKTTINANSCL